MPSAGSPMTESNSQTESMAIRPAILMSSISRQAGGLFTSVLSMTQELAKLGVVSRVYGVEDGDTVSDLSSWSPVAALAVRRGLLGRGAYSTELLPELLKSDATLLHSHGLWMYPSVVTWRWATRTGRPYLVSPHGMLDRWALAQSQYRKRAAMLLYERRNLEQATCLHALNRAEYISLRELGLRNPVAIIPNGVSHVDGAELAHRGTGDRKYLLYLGRVHPKKAVLELVQAWSILKKSHPRILDEWGLRIVGWGDQSYVSDVLAEIERRDLRESVSYLGPRFGNEKVAQYVSASAFILPSRSEGLPMAVLEAWSCALPVFMTEQCNLLDGFLSNAAVRVTCDPHNIASVLSESLVSSSLNDIGMRGRDLVMRDFNWRKSSSSMLAVYKWLALGGQAPDCVQFN